MIDSSLAIAPMIDWTNVHFRVLMRLLAPRAFLYTEMQTTGAILHNPDKALNLLPTEFPLALQIGGSDPKALALCAKKAEMAGFDEVNLNLGCPSDRVQAGRFGACLMKEAAHVAQCIRAMREAVSIPVTAKTRIGVDNQDSYEFFSEFAHGLIQSGCQKLIVHARKAWLNGLSPKQNRTIPPLHYDYAYRIKEELAEIPVIINGNITKMTEIREHLSLVDGVMLGRLACDNPYKIAQIHHGLYPQYVLKTRAEVFALYFSYLKEEVKKGTSLSLLIKPIFNLAYGLNGTSIWKQKLMRVLQTKELGLMDEIVTLLFEIESTICS